MTYELFTVKDLPNGGDKKVIGEIRKIVARHFKVRKRDLTGKLNQPRLRSCRHVAIFLVKKFTSPEVTSNRDIAEAFGLVHYTSVFYSCRRVKGAGPITQEVVAAVEKKVKAALQALKQEGGKKRKKKRKKK